LRHSIKRGIFVSADDASIIIKKIFNDLKVTDPSNITVFITQPVILPKNNKKELAEVFFEENDTQYLFFGTQSVLSLFAHGKSDGIVVESGDGVTQVATVFNGYKIENSFEQIAFGGFDVSLYLKFLFKRNGLFVHSSAEDSIFGEMKKNLCHVNIDPTIMDNSGNRNNSQQISEVDYTLPDGSKVKVKNERFLAGELLFNPSIAGIAFCGIPELLENAISKIDIDLSNHLCKSIYLSGGNTQMSGFVERFAKEVSKLSDNNFERTVIAPNGDRSILAFKGGSVITNMSSFVKFWISKKEYQEIGDRIFLTKFF
jgi:actin-related protein